MGSSFTAQAQCLGKTSNFQTIEVLLLAATYKLKQSTHLNLTRTKSNSPNIFQTLTGTKTTHFWKRKYLHFNTVDFCTKCVILVTTLIRSTFSTRETITFFVFADAKNKDKNMVIIFTRYFGLYSWHVLLRFYRLW